MPITLRTHVVLDNIRTAAPSNMHILRVSFVPYSQVFDPSMKKKKKKKKAFDLDAAVAGNDAEEAPAAKEEEANEEQDIDLENFGKKKKKKKVQIDDEGNAGDDGDDKDKVDGKVIISTLSSPGLILSNLVDDIDLENFGKKKKKKKKEPLNLDDLDSALPDKDVIKLNFKVIPEPYRCVCVIS